MKADAIVIGGGLAGAILAWTLREQGASVVVFDQRGLSNCSRVAAGLYHPVTGRRLALAWRARELLDTGRRLFRTIEERSGQAIFHPLPIRRRFADLSMAETWSRRRDEALRSGLSFQEFEHEPDDPIRSDHGGYELEGCGYVDTGRLIAAIAAPLIAEDRWIDAEVTPEEIEIHADGVRCRGIEADQVVFAQGHLGRLNPLWHHLPFRPLHGEILDLRIEGELRPCIHLGKIFLVPRGYGLWNAGATYDRTIECDKTTEKGRRTLEDELQAFLRLPYQVVGHRAGVRPASGDTMPFIGRHPDVPGAWIFNGFGSRSLLLAPYGAEQLAGALLTGSPLPEAIDVARFERKRIRTRPFRATVAAWEAIAEVLSAGDLAIDATAGNGHDTVWLAERVGPKGRVLACDIQPRAIRITRERLKKARLQDRVRLEPVDHAHLSTWVPGDWSGRIQAVMFSLGVISKGDPSIHTRPETTLDGLEAALEILVTGGRLTVVVNPAQPAGDKEARAIRNWMTTLPADRYRVDIVNSSTPSVRDPWLLVITVN